MYLIYGALLGVAWAVLLPYQIVITVLSERRWPRLRERAGHPEESSPAPLPGGFWLHAVSVGEVRLALPLAARLRALLPAAPIHLTTNTPTGRGLAEAARRRGDPGAPGTLSLLPFDFRVSMGRLLDALRPRAVLILETEIWPNLLRACAARRVPVLLVNGRISPRAYRRYRLVRRFLRRPLGQVRCFGMQSEEDADRIRDLGAPAERVRVTGNLKFDLPVPDVAPAEARRRLGLAFDMPLFVAGSTAPGEEVPVLEAFAALRRRAPRARLALAPRHPERFAAAGAALRRAGLRVVPLSGLAEGVDHDALLVDVVGVLPDIYAAADVVFVGGSLVRRGGHNVLEPAALGKPVLFGPYMENFRGAARALAEAGGGFEVRGGRDLGEQAVRLLLDREAHGRAAAAARRAVEANRGALDRTVGMIAEALEMRGDPARAVAARP
jgi:3-deoxy-D-manno-octulosonic-acid transferase